MFTFARLWCPDRCNTFLSCHFFNGFPFSSHALVDSWTRIRLATGEFEATTARFLSKYVSSWLTCATCVTWLSHISGNNRQSVFNEPLCSARWKPLLFEKRSNLHTSETSVTVFVLNGVGWGRVLNFSWTHGSKVFGDELSQTRIYYVICLTYKFCLRSKSEREKKTITIIFLVVVVF